jgi:AraC-like DNA-binding protein
MADRIRAAVLTGYAELARSVGLDPYRSLDAVEIPHAALSDPDLRIPAVAVWNLLEQSSRALDDFGLRLSTMRTPSIMGPVALVVREQATVRDAFLALGRYLWLHSEVNKVTAEDVGDDVIIRSDLTRPPPGPGGQSHDLALGQLVQVARLFLGTEWRPSRVAFVHPPPKSLDTYRRVFGPDLDFNQAFDGMVCSRADFDRPNPSADPEMARQIEHYLDWLTGSTGATLLERVRDLVGGLLSTGHCNIHFAAAQLGLDARTLRRRLARLQTRFIDIVQDVRIDLATQYIDHSDRPLAEVAELLGFSSLGAFLRWHRRYFPAPAGDRRDATPTPATFTVH